MRAEILAGLQALTLGTFAVSSELPYDSSGQPLYLKNLKTFYVDETDFSEDAQITTLDGQSINVTQRLVRVWVACDAKTRPTNYSDLVVAVRALRNLDTITGVIRRECDTNRSFDESIMITEFVFRFTEI